MARPKKPLFDSKEATACVELFNIFHEDLITRGKKYIAMEKIARIIHRDRTVVQRYFLLWQERKLTKYDPNFTPKREYFTFINPPTKSQLMARR